jgi:hypothetical protein
VHHNRSDARLGSHSVANHGICQTQFGHGATLRPGLGRTGHERSVSYAKRGHAAYCTEVNGQSRATGVIQSGGVDHEHIWQTREVSDGQLEQRPFP